MNKPVFGQPVPFVKPETIDRFPIMRRGEDEILADKWHVHDSVQHEGDCLIFTEHSEYVARIKAGKRVAQHIVDLHNREI